MSPSEKLLKKRKVTAEGCWEYTGYIHPSGYGQTTYQLEKWFIHRLAFFLFKSKEFNKYLQVCHKCDNKKCFNPEHLFIGTQSDNIKDSVLKGRNFKKNIANCPRGHLYNDKNTYYRSDGSRECKICIYERNKQRRLFNV